MAKKVFKYRGLTIEELKKLSLKEFMALLPSRERRTLKRGFTHEEKNLLKKLEKKDNVRTHERQMVIIPKLVGKTILVHNGKDFIPVKVTEEMIGHRLGEFALTRKRAIHTSLGVGAKKKK